MNQKDFTNIILILVIVVVAGAVGYFVLVRPQSPVAPTQTQNSGQTGNVQPETKQGLEGFLFTNYQEWKALEGFDVKSNRLVDFGVLPEAMEMGSEPYIFNKQLFYASRQNPDRLVVFNLETKQSRVYNIPSLKGVKLAQGERDNPLFFVNGVLPLNDGFVYLAICGVNGSLCDLKQFDLGSNEEKSILKNFSHLMAIKSGDAKKFIISNLDGQKVMYYEISAQPFSKKEIGYIDHTQFPKLNVVAKDSSFESVLKSDPRTSLLKIGINDLRADIQQDPPVVKATCSGSIINLNDQKFVGKELVACLKL